MGGAFRRAGENRRALGMKMRLTGARRFWPLLVSMIVAPLLVMQPMTAQPPRPDPAKNQMNRINVGPQHVPCLGTLQLQLQRQQPSPLDLMISLPSAGVFVCASSQPQKFPRAHTRSDAFSGQSREPYTTPMWGDGAGPAPTRLKLVAASLFPPTLAALPNDCPDSIRRPHGKS